MDYREDRFDRFGFESPFAPGEGEGAGLADAGPPENEAWESEGESGSDPLKLASMLAIPGRFDDPKRDPSIDKDGTRFEVFLKGGDRAAFAEKWLSGRPALAASSREPQGDLKSGEIAKAWFVIHDVGVKSSLRDTRFKAKDTKRTSVHGFVNRAGNYAATHDFAKRKYGTIYEFVSKRGQTVAGGKTVNIETVPDIEVVDLRRDGTLPAPSNAATYASIGFRKNRPARGKATYFKWTHAAFDVTADLYILASARAGHLLTLTAHKEMDRNLGRSVIWRERSAAEMANATSKYLKAARDRPSDYHGDPYAFDFQALYDIITRKLNALGGAQMPMGARYGIHPLRVRKADGEDIGNGDSQKHDFPHQSDPVIKRDTGLKKAGWWTSAKAGDGAKETDSEDYGFEYFDDESDPGHAFEDNEGSLDLANEDESLAWLDLEEAEADVAQFEEEAGKAPQPPGGSKPLLGGQLWSSFDPAFGTKQAIFVSPAALNQGRAEILFYVHGLLGPCGGRPRGGVASFISDDKFALGASVVASGRPIILIVPQFQDAGDASWSTHGLAPPEALNRYLDRRMAEIGRRLQTAPPVASNLIVAGHSKAYEVLYRLAGSHGSAALAQMPLSGLWLLDASYGRFPQASFAALLAAKPGLGVTVVYRAGSRTDSFGSKRRTGRLAFVPVPARAVSHCAVPARCLADLLANRPVAASNAVLPVREDSYALDYANETEDEGLFEPEDEASAWQESYDEDADGEDEAEDFDHDMWGSENGEDTEAFEPFTDSEIWSRSPDQIAFRERVLAAHIKQKEKSKGQRALPDLTKGQLAPIPGTDVRTRKDTAQAAGRLLVAANAALAAARAAGDADALKIRSISATSGYRSGSDQLGLWRRVFSAKGGYFDRTQALRQSLPGGPYSDEAIAYMLKAKGEGGFGLGWRIAAPGFSNHQRGIAVDFLVNLQNGGTIKLDSRERYRAIWRRSWFHKWMKANAATFGFKPLSSEEWHWDYRPETVPKPQNFDAFDDEDEADMAFESDAFEDGAENEDFEDETGFDGAGEDFDAFDTEADETVVQEALDPALSDLAERIMSREAQDFDLERPVRWTSCFSDADAAKVKKAYDDNTTAADANGIDRCSCIVMLNVALGQLLSLGLKQSRARSQSERRVMMAALTTETIEKAMGQLRSKGYATSPALFNFFDRRNRTAGTLRPERLKKSVAKYVVDNTKQNCWAAFGLSIMDGYHSVLLLVDRTGAATKIYWLDQFTNGLGDDMTGSLDQRLTERTQTFWQGVMDIKKVGYNTTIRLWKLRKRY